MQWPMPSPSAPGQCPATTPAGRMGSSCFMSFSGSFLSRRLRGCSWCLVICLGCALERGPPSSTSRRPSSTALTRSAPVPALACLVEPASSASSTGCTDACSPVSIAPAHAIGLARCTIRRGGIRASERTCTSQTCFDTRSTICDIIVPKCSPNDRITSGT